MVAAGVNQNGVVHSIRYHVYLHCVTTCDAGVVVSDADTTSQYNIVYHPKYCCFSAFCNVASFHAILRLTPSIIHCTAYETGQRAGFLYPSFLFGLSVYLVVIYFVQ